MENRMALDLFIGIIGSLCVIVCTSILLGKLVMWIQEQLRLRKEVKELGRIVQQQKRWENLEKELAKLDNSSAIDMASDPKPWQPTQQKCPKCGSGSASLHQLNHTAYWRCMQCKEHYELVVQDWPSLPASEAPKMAEPKDEIQEAPHTLWCPRCNSGKRHLAHAVGGVPHFKCEDCGQRYKQTVISNPTKPGPARYDRNAVPTDTPSPSSSDLEGNWPGVIILDEIAPYPPETIDTPNKGGWNDTQDEPVTFGGGDFGGSGAGASYDSSSGSDSSSTDANSSSDYSSSNDDWYGNFQPL